MFKIPIERHSKNDKIGLTKNNVSRLFIASAFCFFAFLQPAFSMGNQDAIDLSKTDRVSQTSTTSKKAVSTLSSRKSSLTTTLKTSSAFQHAIIFGLLRDRCSWYLPQVGASVIEKKKTEIFCLRLSYELIKSLDSTIITENDPVTKRATNGMTVVFINDLKVLLQDKKILKYLKEMKTEVELAYENKKIFDLYLFTLAHAQSQFEAVRWIATLLQDTSTGQSVIEWLKRNPTSDWSKNPKLTDEIVSELSDINYFFREELPTLKRPTTNFNLYPGSTDASTMNIQFYHFYVPAYLTSKLSRLNFSKPFAAFAPFIFNYLYEVSNGAEAVGRIWNEPKNILDLKTQEDIYLGYFGPLWALGLDKKALEFTHFKEGLRTNPALLLHNVSQDSWVISGLQSSRNHSKVEQVTEPTENFEPLEVSQCESIIVDSKKVVQLRVRQCRQFSSYQTKSNNSLFHLNKSVSTVAGSEKLFYKIQWQTIDFFDPVHTTDPTSSEQGLGFSTGDAMTQCLDNRPTYESALVSQNDSSCR